MNTENKYWLVFYDDHGHREDCNVFYSNLVLAPTAEAAIKKVPHYDPNYPDRLCAEEMNLIN